MPGPGAMPRLLIPSLRTGSSGTMSKSRSSNCARDIRFRPAASTGGGQGLPAKQPQAEQAAVAIAVGHNMDVQQDAGFRATATAFVMAMSSLVDVGFSEALALPFTSSSSQVRRMG